MTTLNELRGRVRRDLRDTDAAAYRWDDAQLDRHIGRALAELSLAMPRELSALVATVPGSRELPLAGLEGLIAVEGVAYPVGVPAGWTRWGERVFLETERTPAGEDAEVRYMASHVLDEEGSTLPEAFMDVLATGAAAFAAVEMSAGTIDRLNTGGAGVPGEYGAWGRARMTAFRQLLRMHGREGKLGMRRLTGGSQARL
jgi:hypothetical protein